MALFEHSIKAVFHHEGVEKVLNDALFKESGKRAGIVDVPANARKYNCSVEGCDRKAYAKHLCNAHYIRIRKGIPIENPIAHRKHGNICTECNAPLNGKGGWGLCGKHFKPLRYQLLKSTLVQSFGDKCQRCGDQHPPEVYDFHHNGVKGDAIGKLLSSGSVKRLAEEAVKCVLLCANCHRKEHGNGII